MDFITSMHAPAPIGPYSQAVLINNFLFMSGQLGLEPNTFALKEGIEAQTHQIFNNINAILKACNKSFENVIKTTIFLINLEDFSTVNIIYTDYFESHRPARSCVGVNQLPKNALIEIECIAY